MKVEILNFRNSLSFKPIDHYFGCNWTGKLAGNYTFMLNTKIGIINDGWFSGRTLSTGLKVLM